MKFLPAAGALAMLIISAPRAVAAETPSADALLRQSCLASGDAALRRLAGAEVTGVIEAGGLKGLFRQRIDFRQGRDVTTFDLGATKGAQGVEPDRSWWTDEKGLTGVEDGPDAVADAVTASYNDRDGWCRPGDAAPAAWLGPQVVGGRTFDLVGVTPPGGRPLTVWIDPATHFVARIVFRDSQGRDNTSTLSDYREVAGAWFPFAERDSSGDPRFDQVLRVERIDVRTDLGDADFAPPASVVRDARLLEGPASVPFALKDGLIVVEVSINGEKPLPFVLDSGALNALTPEAAAALGVQGQGSVPMSGAGAAQAPAQLARVGAYRVGPAELSDQQFVILPLPRDLTDNGAGPPVAGTIGYEFLRRFIVRIDYHARTLTVRAPDAADPSSPGEAKLPLVFDGRESYVKASVDRIEGYFSVDTGDDGAAMLYRAFYAGHAIPIELPGLAGYGSGIGGATPMVLTRVDDLALGPFTLSRPLTTLNFAAAGGFASSRVAGALGAQIWRNFIVTFDYPHQAIWLKKSPDFGFLMPYNRTGLLVDADDRGSTRVAAMAPDSPAAAAGLRVGDTLVAIDGRAVRGVVLSKLAEWVAKPAGETIAVEAMRNGKPLSAVITTRELLPIDGVLQLAPRAFQ